EGQLLGEAQRERRDQAPLALALQLRRPLAADAQLPPVLRARRHLEGHATAVRRRLLDACAERGLRVRDRDVDDEIVVAPLEQLRRLHARDDEEVARRAAVLAQLAFALEADAGAVLYAGGNLDGGRVGAGPAAR